MTLDQLLQTFIAECAELLEDMETSLLRIEQQGANSETINAIFRAAHTIKGSGGLFGLDPLVQFTHIAENVLDRVRNGNLSFTQPLITLMLECTDHIRALVAEISAGALTNDSPVARAGEPLIEKLKVYLDDAAAISAPVIIYPNQASTVESNEQEDLWNIDITFGPDVMRGGTSLLSLVRCIYDLGSITKLITRTDRIPPLDEINAEDCHLSMAITLLSQAKLKTIENIFEFIREECDLRIHASQREIIEQLSNIDALPESDARIGEILVKAGVVTQARLEAALASQSKDLNKRPLGVLLIEEAAVDPKVIEAAINKQKKFKTRKAPKDKSTPEPEIPKFAETRSVRVDADKLDYMINLVGELITAAAGADLNAKRGSVSAIQESTSHLLSLVEAVRESALQLRMVKIGATFARFQRVVHDVSKELNKDIQLLVNGEETELDKTVVEKITDPLTHLVRNAMDHGIESAETRRARGKSERGTVRLNAFHDSGNIIIEVSDDGGGLNRDKIIKKATERGLIESAQGLSDSEIFNLIFEPGFSTAEKVTNLSGRGVGMDVVRRNITMLRGSVNVHSQDGLGTTVSIRLPLTLAIINGFLVGLANAVYVIPLDTIEECVRLAHDTHRGYLNLRGEVLPLIHLADALGLSYSKAVRRESVVVVRIGNHKAGLVVDRLLGEFQTVIKPLGPLFRDQHCVAGFTILGSGEVSLILDVSALLTNARMNELITDSNPTKAVSEIC